MQKSITTSSATFDDVLAMVRRCEQTADGGEFHAYIGIDLDTKEVGVYSHIGGNTRTESVEYIYGWGGPGFSLEDSCQCGAIDPETGNCPHQARIICECVDVCDHGCGEPDDPDHDADECMCACPCQDECGCDESESDRQFRIQTRQDDAAEKILKKIQGWK